jgi:hypothetical protein
MRIQFSSNPESETLTWKIQNLKSEVYNPKIYNLKSRQFSATRAPPDARPGGSP